MKCCKEDKLCSRAESFPEGRCGRQVTEEPAERFWI